MCKWNDTKTLRVLIPAHISHNGKMEWREKKIDSCLVPMIEFLNNHGLLTLACCCGHGKGPGSIIFHDGTLIEIREKNDVQHTRL